MRNHAVSLLKEKLVAGELILKDIASGKYDRYKKDYIASYKDRVYWTHLNLGLALELLEGKKKSILGLDTYPAMNHLMMAETENGKILSELRGGGYKGFAVEYQEALLAECLAKEKDYNEAIAALMRNDKGESY